MTTKGNYAPGANTPSAPGAARSLPMLANSLALIVGKLATMGLGFLAWLAAARLFDQHDVGLASGAVSAMMLCVQIALFGAGAAVISLYPRVKDQPDSLINTSFTLVTVYSLAVTGIFLMFAWLFLNQLSILATHADYALAFTVMTVTGTLGVLFDQLSTVLRRGDQALVRGVSTGIGTLALVIGFPSIFDAKSAFVLLLAWAGGSALSVLIGVGRIHRSLPGYRFRPETDRTMFRQINQVGIPNWLLTLTERAPGAILPIVVTEVLSPQANAAWYAAWMMAWVVYVVPIQVGLNLFAEASHSPAQFDRAVRNGVLTSLVIGIGAAVGAAILGPILLEFLGSGYSTAGTTPLRILLIAVLPFTFVQAYFAICRARMMLGEAIPTGLISAVVGIASAAIAGERYGLNGMATAWLATQCLLGIWSVVRLRSFRDVSRSATAGRQIATP